LIRRRSLPRVKATRLLLLGSSGGSGSLGFGGRCRRLGRLGRLGRHQLKQKAGLLTNLKAEKVLSSSAKSRQAEMWFDQPAFTFVVLFEALVLLLLGIGRVVVSAVQKRVEPTGQR
jgi:hypothetical protein